MPKISALTSSTTAPADTDVFATVEAMGGVPLTKRKAWSVLKAALKIYFDGLYLSLTGGSISGGLNVGSATGAGTGDVYASGAHCSLFGSASCLHATATTVYTLPTVAYPKMYMVAAHAGGTSASYMAWATIATDGGFAELLHVANSTNLSITISGLNVRVTQISGTTLTCYVSILRFL